MKEHYKNSIVHYFNYLSDNKHEDPVKAIIDDFVSTIKISSEQKKYIYESFDKRMDTDEELEIFKNMLSLIEYIKPTQDPSTSNLEFLVSIEKALNYLISKRK